ncbi:MAG TPA: acVLRF1 family peptidyl-tRNA hydrolase [Sporichthyaceae bacterium]|nr:acVLRF1 family peptidyl-tRNA hydrolase [Sporichthyaceae bacterium]
MRSVDVDAGRIARWLENFTERNGASVVLTVTADGARAVADNGTIAEMVVPFAHAWSPPEGPDGPRIGPARILLTRALSAHALAERTVGVLLVRLGGQAAGVFVGEALQDSKIEHRLVQGRTAAGGRSQQRFARRRANQADAVRADAADIAVRVLLPHLDRLDALVLGGERTSVDTVLADKRLAPLRAVPTEPRFLTVPDPRLVVLKSTPPMFRSIRIQLTDPD